MTEVEQHASELAQTCVPEEMLSLTRTALAEAEGGRLLPVIGQTFPLEEASRAHAAIESRATIGKTLLVVRGEYG